MKKFLILLIIVCLALNITGCSDKQTHHPPATTVQTAPVDSGNFGASIDSKSTTNICSIVLPTYKETVTADDGTTLFTLSYQQTQLLLGNSTLEEKILGDLQTRNGSILSQAAEIEDQAQLDYSAGELWSEYFIDISYVPTRLDRMVLSLFGNSVSYCGGPHPAIATNSVTYDLETGDVLWLVDILTQECTSDTLYQMVLDCLAEQEAVLYYDYADALAERFSKGLHNIPDWYFSRNGLCFHFSPYDIAPYSSGTIIAELPYSELDGILQDKYFPEEVTTATGSVYAGGYSEDVNERFSNITDVSLSENGNEILLYSDAAVIDLRIEAGWRYADNDQYIPRSTVFATNIMDIGDGIHLTSDLNDETMVLRLVYRADGQEYSSFITYDTQSDSVSLYSD